MIKFASFFAACALMVPAALATFAQAAQMVA